MKASTVTILLLVAACIVTLVPATVLSFSGQCEKVILSAVTKNTNRAIAVEAVACKEYGTWRIQ